MIRYYYYGLPFSVSLSVTTSICCGLSEIINDVDKVIYPHHKLFNMMGIVSLGGLIGVSYPISMPLLMARYLYRNRIV